MFTVIAPFGNSTWLKSKSDFAECILIIQRPSNHARNTPSISDADGTFGIYRNVLLHIVLSNLIFIVSGRYLRNVSFFYSFKLDHFTLPGLFNYSMKKIGIAMLHTGKKKHYKHIIKKCFIFQVLFKRIDNECPLTLLMKVGLCLIKLDENL